MPRVSVSSACAEPFSVTLEFSKPSSLCLNNVATRAATTFRVYGLGFRAKFRV